MPLKLAETDRLRDSYGRPAAWLDRGSLLGNCAEEVVLKPVIASREFIVGFATMALILTIVLVIASSRA